ncbi:nicotinate-nucleotide adenylyltransferase [Luteimonas suaedae]|uniref:nicotinate-nucleotide adenylyltransferase n=1 Tax=Luteimonas suaedae TaxID=2605430 RepID=UPI0011EEE0F1|nr:nicotinate-nucleotide adenylyltransferase [Luteimonas suaedae]
MSKASADAGPGSLLVLYGGTFDPVHNGHLAIARAARDRLRCAVHLMPAADPPHRPAPGADARQRVAMLELAVAGERDLYVDRRELARDGRSYTVATLRELRAGEGAVARPVALLVGADSFVGLPAWREWRALFDLAHFVVAERAGSPLDQALPAALAGQVAGRLVDDPAALSAAPAGRILPLRQPLSGESATDLRRRLAEGRPWRHLLPAPVADYINRHRLYRDDADTASPL